MGLESRSIFPTSGCVSKRGGVKHVVGHAHAAATAVDGQLYTSLRRRFRDCHTYEHTGRRRGGGGVMMGLESRSIFPTSGCVSKRGGVKHVVGHAHAAATAVDGQLYMRLGRGV